MKKVRISQEEYNSRMNNVAQNSSLAGFIGGCISVLLGTKLLLWLDDRRSKKKLEELTEE